MTLETLLICAIPLSILIGALFAAYKLGRARNRLGLQTYAVIWVLFTSWMFFALGQTNTWDGLIYLLALMGISAPSGVGAFIGGLIGFNKQEKAAHA